MHSTYLLKRYSLIAALTMIGLALLSTALSLIAGIQLGGTLGIVSAIVPALDAGQVYGKRWEKRPENGFAWKLAAAFVVLNFVVSIMLVAIMTAWIGEFAIVVDAISDVGVLIFGGIMTVIFLIYWLASRYFFGYGAKLAIRAHQTSSKTNQP